MQERGFYFIVLEDRSGQTVGKKVMRMVVVTQDGKRITLKQSIIRNVLRVLDALPFLYLIGLIAIVLTKRKQRIGDITAKTIVVEMK